jgi:hypothetical protein
MPARARSQAVSTVGSHESPKSRKHVFVFSWRVQRGETDTPLGSRFRKGFALGSVVQSYVQFVVPTPWLVSHLFKSRVGFSGG